MQLIEADDIESKSSIQMTCRRAQYRHPNRFFTGLANGVIFSLAAWGFIYAMMVWMY
jgi:hypothetical protein